MKILFSTFAGVLALTLSAPATAQDSGKTADNIEQAQIEPARLAAAKVTVDYLFPLGTYERMMKGTMDEMLNSIISQSLDRPLTETMKGYGIDDAALDEMEDASINDMMLQLDPHFEERMQITTKVTLQEMVDLMISMEPTIRATLSNVYARKFTEPQLAEMNTFFATKTGSAFASEYMMVFVDPEMMEAMMSFMPEIMQAMPEIMKKIEEATAHLPPLASGPDAQMQKDGE